MRLLGSWTAADSDKKVFTALEEGRTTLRVAKLQIARNNKLDYIPSDDEFRALYFWLGYRWPRKRNGVEVDDDEEE